MRPHGRISFGGLVLLLAVVGGMWTLISVGPAYLDNLDVSEAVAAATNRAAHGYDDERLARQILEVGKRVGYHMGEDDEGNYTELPGLGLTRDNVIIERDYTTSRITIRVEYDRFMVFKPLEQGLTVSFAPERTGVFRQ